MPWRVDPNHPDCSGYAVVKKDTGKLVACHKDRGSADAQVRALYANEAQTAAAVGNLARELLEDGGRDALIARAPFVEAQHPRYPAGQREGGRFRVVENDAGRFEVVNPNGKKVAETTTPEDADEFAELANARETRVPIPSKGAVTSVKIPNAWAVEQGYADYVDSPFGETTFYGARRNPTTPGSITWKPGVDPEMVLAHYLSGKRPVNFEPGTLAYEQWMYGRQEPADTPLMPGVYSRPYESASDRRARREARKARQVKRPGDKAEREAMIRRITAALAACGFVIAGDEPDEALVASLRTELVRQEMGPEFFDDTVDLLTKPLDGLTAAVEIADFPPSSFFEPPPLTKPAGVVITADGRVYGYLALWDACHMGEPGGPGVCVAPPKSGTGYSLFHLGEVETAEGDLIPTGKITLGTGHASLQASRNAAAAHYDNTGSVVADVRVGEDQRGIWYSGALRSHVTPAQVRELRASQLSGDWRRYRNALELVAALAVNVPGFPIPRVAALVAPELDGDERMALVAAGIAVPQPMSALEIDARIDALGLLAGVAEF